MLLVFLFNYEIMFQRSLNYKRKLTYLVQTLFSFCLEDFFYHFLQCASAANKFLQLPYVLKYFLFCLYFW